MITQVKKFAIVLQANTLIWNLSIQRSDVIPTARKAIDEMTNIAI